MKRLLNSTTASLFFIFSFYFSLHPHGFSDDTPIWWYDSTEYTLLKDVVEGFKKNKQFKVTSYDEHKEKYLEKQARCAGATKVPYYFELHFLNEDKNNFYNEVIINPESEKTYKNFLMCSPTQEFFRLPDKKWVAIQDLRVGDQLLCHQSKSVYISYIWRENQPLKTYTLQVRGTKTFIVGHHKVVAHNLELPIELLPIYAFVAANLTFCTSTGLGPIGIVGGILLGAGWQLYVNGGFRKRFVDYEFSIKPPLPCGTVFKEQSSPAPCGNKDTIISPSKESNCSFQGNYNQASATEIKETKPVEKPKEKSKEAQAAADQEATLEDVLGDSIWVEDKQKADIWEKKGGIVQGKKDFEDFNPSERAEISTGERGKLSDGRDINIRIGSSDTRPTLEIYNRVNKSRLKIRYDE